MVVYSATNCRMDEDRRRCDEFENPRAGLRSRFRRGCDDDYETDLGSDRCLCDAGGGTHDDWCAGVSGPDRHAGAAAIARTGHIYQGHRADSAAKLPDLPSPERTGADVVADLR